KPRACTDGQGQRQADEESLFPTRSCHFRLVQINRCAACKGCCYLVENERMGEKFSAVSWIQTLS
ncbi:hypothetical protein, partial [Pseudomonas savastanoi]|uniref:hypothetical protein n=1 Tax=Pseudomonas savastanoi TaxID=29438 RepID=UPI001C7EDB4F